MVGLFLLIGVAIVADAYWQVHKISDPLEGIRFNLAKARNALSHGKIPEGDPFTAATDVARTAEASVDDTRFTFRLVGHLPFLRRPIDAIRMEVVAANEWSQAATVARQAVLDMLGPNALRGVAHGDEDTPAPIFHDGAADVKLIESLPDRLEELIAHLEAGDRAIRALPTIPFYHRLTDLKTHALEESAQELTLANNALKASRLLPGFLGADEPRTYFLAMQNNSDLRATGGAVLAYAFLTVDDGKLSLGARGRIIDIDNKFGFEGAQVPDAIQWYLDRVPKAFPRIANLNFSPSFPTDAQAWDALVPLSTGTDIDGIIAIDPVAIKEIMGNRKIKVPTYPDTITAKNVVDIIENKQYLLEHPEGIDFTTDFIEGVWQKISDLHPFVKSVNQLGTAIQEKHLQVWVQDPDEEDLLHELGWDGSLKTGPGDYLYVTDNKLKANKVDFYTHTKIHYDVKLGADGTATSTCTVTLTNETPPGLPSAVVGPNAYALNQALIGAYVPQRAEFVSADPAHGYEPHVEGKKRVFVRTVSVLPGSPQTVKFTYSVPDVVQTVDGGKSYTLTVQHEPLVNPADLTITVTLPKGSTVRSALGWSVKGNVATYHQPELTKDFATTILF